MACFLSHKVRGCTSYIPRSIVHGVLNNLAIFDKFDHRASINIQDLGIFYIFYIYDNTQKKVEPKRCLRGADFKNGPFLQRGAIFL